MRGYSLAKQAIERAASEGIYTVSVGTDLFGGLGREPTVDPDRFESYVPGDLAARLSRNKGRPSRLLRFAPVVAAILKRERSRLLVPKDSRCTASATGNSDYTFHRTGGPSWTVPWIAGLYALACQVKPDITPEAFWETARKTSRTVRVTQAGAEVEFGPIISPGALLDALHSVIDPAVE
jgi:hypothetical protein